MLDFKLSQSFLSYANDAATTALTEVSTRSRLDHHSLQDLEKKISHLVPGQTFIMVSSVSGKLNRPETLILQAELKLLLSDSKCKLPSCKMNHLKLSCVDILNVTRSEVQICKDGSRTAHMCITWH